MSRNPKPLHLIQGHLTKEQKRQREEKEQNINNNLRRDKIKPPTWLDKEAKKAFKYIIDQYKEVDMLTNLDVLALARYCKLHSRYLELEAEVEEKGNTLENKNSRGGVTYITNPSLTALNTTIKLLQSYEDRFGFHLIGRTRLTIRDDRPPEDDPFKKRFGL